MDGWIKELTGIAQHSTAQSRDQFRRLTLELCPLNLIPKQTDSSSDWFLSVCNRFTDLAIDSFLHPFVDTKSNTHVEKEYGCMCVFVCVCAQFDYLIIIIIVVVGVGVAIVFFLRLAADPSSSTRSFQAGKWLTRPSFENNTQVRQ